MKEGGPHAERDARISNVILFGEFSGRAMHARRDIIMHHQRRDYMCGFVIAIEFSNERAGAPLQKNGEPAKHAELDWQVAPHTLSCWALQLAPTKSGRICVLSATGQTSPRRPSEACADQVS